MSTLAELKKKALKATPGKREVIRFDNAGGSIDYQVESEIRQEGGHVVFASFREMSNPRNKFDAEFCAALDRETVLALIESVEEMELALGRAKKFASIASDWDSSFPDGFEMDPGEWFSAWEIRNEMQVTLAAHAKRLP